MRYLWIPVLLVLGCGSVAWAGKGFTLPPAHDAAAYPAHQEHPDEHAAVAIDPYDTPTKADIFKVNWREHGYLPVFFVVTNGSDEPIALRNMKVEWVTANRSKIPPATDADLARRLRRSRIPRAVHSPRHCLKEARKGVLPKKPARKLRGRSSALWRLNPTPPNAASCSSISRESRNRWPAPTFM